MPVLGLLKISKRLRVLSLAGICSTHIVQAASKKLIKLLLTCKDLPLS